MTVNSVNSVNSNQGVQQTSWQDRFEQAFAPVAQLFGESSDQLMSELQSGNTSLSALATQKGVSQSDLINAIKQGIQQTSSNGSPTLSDNQLTNIANRIANHKHGGHHHHHHATGPTDAAGSTAGTGSASDLPPAI